MKAIRKINNNASICIDSAGRELVVLGNGVGYGTFPRDIALSEIERTFYGVDPKYLGLIGELSTEVLEFSSQLADLAENTLSYELSRNLPITLADHIAFAIKRAEQHMLVQMPLSYDVQQMYPKEYTLGEIAVTGINRTFKVHLRRAEATGIALSIVNSAVGIQKNKAEEARSTENMLEGATKIVETHFNIKINRNAFDFARFATHVQYLIDRLNTGKPISTANSDLYPVLTEQYPEVSACAARVAHYLSTHFDGAELSEEEQAYLILHITRVKERARVNGCAHESSDETSGGETRSAPGKTAD